MNRLATRTLYALSLASSSTIACGGNVASVAITSSEGDASLDDGGADAGSPTCTPAGGAGWTSMATPLSGTKETLHAVWASSDCDVWVAGDSHGMHWDGRTWTLLAQPYGVGLFGTSADDVWAAGPLHWDGHTWAIPSMTDANLYLGSIWAASRTDAWGVSTGLAPPGHPSRCMSTRAHWDGAAWTETDPPSLNGNKYCFVTIWGASASDVWAFGRADFYPTGPYGEHWDGKVWTADLSVGVTTGVVISAYGTATDDIWAVGTTYSSSGDRLLHWDGNTWSVARDLSALHASAMAVWASARDRAWAVGPDSIVTWDGATWSPASALGSNLRGVWGTSADSVWAVGGNGVVMHFNGQVH